MDSFSVALVARDPSARAALARAFDGAPASWSVELYDERPPDADVVVGSAADSDIVFDEGDPGLALEAVRAVAAARRSSTVCLVTGATSGCGVTSVALQLAASFARRAETCLVDLDTRWRGIAERLDLLDEETKTWGDVREDETSLRRAAVPVRGGFRVLLAPPCAPGGGSPGRSEGLPDAAGADPTEVVRRAAQHFARVVVDLPAHHPPDLIDAATAAGPGVLVAPATRGGARRAAAVLERCSGRRWALVFNRVGAGGQESADRLARRAGTKSALELPCTPTLRDAEEEGRLPEARWTRWSRRIDRLARALERA